MIDNSEKASHSGVVKPSRIGATSHSDAVVPTTRTAVSQSAIMLKAESVCCL